jgi:hypothetical protein
MCPKELCMLFSSSHPFPSFVIPFKSITVILAPSFLEWANLILTARPWCRPTVTQKVAPSLHSGSGWMSSSLWSSGIVSSHPPWLPWAFFPSQNWCLPKSPGHTCVWQFMALHCEFLDGGGAVCLYPSVMSRWLGGFASSCVNFGLEPFLMFPCHICNVSWVCGDHTALIPGTHFCIVFLLFVIGLSIALSILMTMPKNRLLAL